MSNLPLRISAILCGSAVYTSYGTHYRRVAEDRRVTQRGLLRQSYDSPINTAPIVDNGYVYVASFNGTLYALNAQIGAKVWSTNLGANFLQPDETNAEITTGFAAADGILVGVCRQSLIAFESFTPPPSMELLLETSAPLSDQSPP